MSWLDHNDVLRAARRSPLVRAAPEEGFQTPVGLGKNGCPECDFEHGILCSDAQRIRDEMLPVIAAERARKQLIEVFKKWLRETVPADWRSDILAQWRLGSAMARVYAERWGMPAEYSAVFEEEEP